MLNVEKTIMVTYVSRLKIVPDFTLVAILRFVHTQDISIC